MVITAILITAMMMAMATMTMVIWITMMTHSIMKMMIPHLIMAPMMMPAWTMKVPTMIQSITSLMTTATAMMALLMTA